MRLNRQGKEHFLKAMNIKLNMKEHCAHSKLS